MKQNTRIDVLLMSAMKSGSTYLARQFEKRSDVTFVPGQKIVTTPAAGGRIERIIIEAPHLVNEHDLVVGRRNLKLEKFYLHAYYSHNPNMKFVCYLRDPVKRSFSQFRHEIRKRQRRPSWRKGRKVVYDFNVEIADMAQSIFQKSLYWTCLEPYISLFGARQFFVGAFEELIEDESNMLSLIRWLDLDVSNT